MTDPDYSLWLQPRRSRVLECVCALVALAAVACSVRLAGDIAAMADERSTLEAQVNQAQQIKIALGKKKPSKAELEATQQLASLKAEISYPWEVLLLGLERTSQANIELREFVPDRQGKSVTLSGEALSTSDLSDFIEALSREPGFQSIYLASQKVSVRGNLKTVAFQLKAQLRF